MDYAISFDLDRKMLQDSYPAQSWQNAYFDVARSLKDNVFMQKQGSVYFGYETVDVVRCQLFSNSR